MVTSPGSQTVSPRPQLNAQLTESLRRFLRTETYSAGLLLAATVLALAWANSPWATTYTSFWSAELSVSLAGSQLTLDLKHWVNDGLMVFFFFAVGLEVKRELAMGELSDRRRAAVPLIAAAAGLVVPALIYLAFNPGGEAASGWGVVISTDTAFVLGAIALAVPAGSTQLRIFVLTLAVADDIAALSIIAVVYTEDLHLAALGLAALGLGLILLLRFLRAWRGPAYFVVAIGIWLAMHESGVHPTIAGVVIAMFTPAYRPRRRAVEDAARLTHAFRQSPTPEFAREARLGIDRSISPNERIQQLYQPWTSFVIVPIFALANAGVNLGTETLRTAFTSRLTLGIVAGLVVGKLIGVTLGATAAVRLRLGSLPPGLGKVPLTGGAALSGIGFTISLFIVDLAFDDPQLADRARVGVLTASILAAFLGWLILRLGSRRGHSASDQRPRTLDQDVDPERDHIRGRVDAPLTLVEYGDFECPFCGRVTGAVAEVRGHFGDRLRYVFRHLPLTDVHPHAELAARAGEAAAAQGRFWDMHDLLFANSTALAEDDLLRYADHLNLDLQRFATDLHDNGYAERVRQDVASAEASGVRATPTFFIAGQRHIGPHDAASLVDAIEARDNGA